MFQIKEADFLKARILQGLYWEEMMPEDQRREDKVEIIVCVNCGEKISQKWVVCPICARPSKEINNPDGSSESE